MKAKVANALLLETWLFSPMLFYFDLPAFLAQASLQYFDLALKVVYLVLQTGHFFSIPIPAS
jgi:hypothetical protein